MKQETTAHLGLPLPHPNNCLEDDVLHLRAALQGMDAALHSINTTTIESVQQMSEDLSDKIASSSSALQTSIDQIPQQLDNNASAASVEAQSLAQGITAEVQQQVQEVLTALQTLHSNLQNSQASSAASKVLGNFPVIHIFGTSTIHTFTHSGLVFIRALGAGAGGGANVIGGAGGWGQLVKNVSAGDELVCAIGAGGVGKQYGGRSSTGGGSTDITLHGITYSAAGGMSEDDSTPRMSSSNWDYCRHGRAAGQGNVNLLDAPRDESEQLSGWGFRLSADNSVAKQALNGSSYAGNPGGVFAAGATGGVNQAASLKYPGGSGGKGGGGGKGGRYTPSAAEHGDGGVGGDGLVIVYFWPAANP